MSSQVRADGDDQEAQQRAQCEKEIERTRDGLGETDSMIAARIAYFESLLSRFEAAEHQSFSTLPAEQRAAAEQQIKAQYEQNKGSLRKQIEDARTGPQRRFEQCMSYARKQAADARQRGVEELRDLAIGRRFALELWSSQICGHRESIAEARGEMGHERAGARYSGYVDKRALYEAGQTIAQSQRWIGALERALKKNPWLAQVNDSARSRDVSRRAARTCIASRMLSIRTSSTRRRRDR